MKRINLFAIAILLLTALVTGIIFMLGTNHSEHIACIAYVLVAIAFGIVIGYLLQGTTIETNESTKHSKTKPSKIDRPVKRPYNDIPTSTLYAELNEKRNGSETS